MSLYAERDTHEIFRKHAPKEQCEQSELLGKGGFPPRRNEKPFLSDARERNITITFDFLEFYWCAARAK